MEDRDIISAFGKVLKKERISKGLSQEQLAFSIQTHPTHISRLENGHKQPTLTTVFKISEVLGVSPDHLIASVKEELNT